MRTSLILTAALFSVQLHAQVKKTTTTSKPAPKPATSSTGIALKNRTDSVSYAIGVLDGTFFKTQGLAGVNSTILGQAFKEALAGNTKLTPEQCNEILRVEMERMKSAKVQPNIDQGKAFMASNKKRPEVKETASGIQYEIITLGTGAKPVDTSVVKVHYHGTFLNGQVFDSSRDRGQPITFRMAQVIAGWQEILKLMAVGTRLKCWIPYNLSYGLQDYNGIPGGSTLVFDMELIDIVPGSGNDQ
jgi:FKBP-type peptidyl-prolyl cis-trans isomerase FklB